MTLAAKAVVPLYAGFWRRAAAAVIDSLVLIIPNIAVSVALYNRPGLTFLVNLLVSCAYFALFHASERGATPGKMLFGVRVTDLAGERISIARGVGRYFATWVSTIILCIGWLMAAFTQRKQALHDMIAGTLVVNAKATPEEVAAGGDPMPITGGVWAVIALLVIFPFFGGILAAIAIPAYQDYSVRAHVVEAIASSAALRGEIEQSLQSKQPVAPRAVEVSSQHVQSIEVTNRGEVSIVFAARVANGGRLVWTPTVEPSGSVSWACSSPDISPKYLPVRCRG